ncbi:sigma 54-interacting transcriptional regulator, partial [Deltaproteobacteria bacterium OttesenSCG-928-K17]|nr:sigma 54-interacting transcriptional regulator [Deltaproteobacteria bacterium OttesenSCG-928-K17]
MSDWPFQSITRELVSQLYDDYHEGLFILDSQGRIVYYNRLMGKMDGVANFEVTGKHFIDIYNLNEKTSVSLGALAQQKPMKNRTIFYRTRMGTLVNAYCNSYPFFEEGRLAGAFCFTTDYNVASTALEELTRNYALQTQQGPAEVLPAALDAPHTFANLVGGSKPFLEAVEKAKVAAEHNMPIMLVGETGCGKELFAQSIHNQKPGRKRRFMAVNCPAIPENLLESLLFGTTKGSFTGALDKPGIFEAADGGTIFLDEINSMPMDLQSKLLRVLQEKKVSRVGSTKEVRVDCQIISATSHNPYAEMAAQRLRQDLFYRLGAVLVHIPPLRERAEDIGLLCGHFIKKHK